LIEASPPPRPALTVGLPDGGVAGAGPSTKQLYADVQRQVEGFVVHVRELSQGSLSEMLRTVQ